MCRTTSSIAGTRAVVFAAVVCLGAVVAHERAAGADTDGLKIARSRVTGFASFVTAADGGVIDVEFVGGRAELQPISFFETHGELFGVSDPQRQLNLSKASTDRIGHTHTTFQQTHRGVPVFSGVLKVHQDATGSFVAANGDFYPIPTGLNTVPTLSGDVAARAAVATYGDGAPIVGRTTLMVVDPVWYGAPPKGVHLAYYIILDESPAGRVEAFFIDAHNGAVLDRWNMIDFARDREIHDAAGGTGIPGPLARTEGMAAVGDADVDAAYDYYGDTYDYFDRAFGRDGIDDAGLTMVATVDSNAPACPNAFWSPSRLQMVFCAGTVTDDIVGHELMHGVTQFTAGLIYQFESGQLNESYSDIFGELIDLYNGDAAFAGPPGGPPNWPAHPTGPGLDVPNSLRTACSFSPGHADGVRWLLGEDATAFGGAIRDLWDPTCYGHPDRKASPLQTCSVFDSGGVHSGSGIPNHAFALLTDGGTFNGETVTGIGPIKAAAVWYRALTTYLTPASDFDAAYVAFNQSASDLIGTTPNEPRTGGPSASAFTAADATEVNNALKAVEMDIAGSSCTRGACCIQVDGECDDNVREVDCQAVRFEPNVACANLNPPCVEPGSTARMIVLLDRTGSMRRVRSSTGNTRCFDALEQAKDDVVTFLGNDPGRTLAVWTFAGSGPTDLTGGFVDQATALANLATLDGVQCTGSTPLAESICDAADAFPAGLPVEDKLIAVSSDGGENTSSGPCDGPTSPTGPPYDPGSWQQKVLDKIQGNAVISIRYWDVFGSGEQLGQTIDVETGLPKPFGVTDQVFFQHVAGATGGTYDEIPDSAPDTEACCFVILGGPPPVCDDLPPDDCTAASGTPRGPGTVCTIPRGCCLPGGCQDLDPQCCEELGGIVLISGTSCDLQACCMANNSCEVRDRCDCDGAGGTPQGEGTDCELVACCPPVGPCSMAMDRCACLAAGGTPEETGVTCAIEACCLPNGTCTMTDRCDCRSSGGNPQGTGSVCTVPEACCLPDDTCSMVDPLCCEDLGGTPQGTATICTAAERCCLPSGTCADLDPVCCDNLGGQSAGLATSCDLEACCMPNGFCLETDPDCCTAAGGTPTGPGSTCDFEACCLEDGLCIMSNAGCCAAGGGSPQGGGSSCTSREGCCMPDGTCSMLDPLCCEAQNGNPQGAGTGCTGLEACCAGNGTCSMLDALCCAADAGNSRGAGSACAALQGCILPNGDCTAMDAECCLDLGGSPLGFNAHCPIPATSDWGLVVLTLLVLVAGTLIVNHRRSTMNAES